ncbi:hypothetical protein [Burkholderia ubonensis]|uniref:hypothetical protein n=1 Tax=Burkholderia ubonensis TaxID=101571 RepID=UPI0012F9C33A|nr:hypothetical protein [Burkholderia ubonensis]
MQKVTDGDRLNDSLRRRQWPNFSACSSSRKISKKNVTRLIEIFRSVRTLPLAALKCHARRIFIFSDHSCFRGELMRELNHRDISLISGGVFIGGSIVGINVAGRNAIGAGVAIGNGANITVNGKRIESNFSSHSNSASTSISYRPTNYDWTSHISSFWAGWLRNFFKQF